MLITLNGIIASGLSSSEKCGGLFLQILHSSDTTGRGRLGMRLGGGIGVGLFDRYCMSGAATWEVTHPAHSWTKYYSILNRISSK